MSRSERNNPTLRMGRVLDDFDALDAAYDSMAAAMAEPFAVIPPTGLGHFECEAIQTYMLRLFQAMAPKPLAEAVINEKARRQYTLGRVAVARNRMRVVRSRSKTDPSSQAQTRGAFSDLTKEEAASILSTLTEQSEPDHED